MNEPNRSHAASSRNRGAIFQLLASNEAWHEEETPLIPTVMSLSACMNLKVCTAGQSSNSTVILAHITLRTRPAPTMR
eukprot:958280-Amphidinium_carterae.2